MYILDTYDVISECEKNMLENYLKLESIHPIDIIDNKLMVMHEATLNKVKIRQSLDTIIDTILKTIEKFKSITRDLKTKNSKWLAEAKQFNLNKTDLSNFKFEMFPYWNAIPELYNNIKIPNFSKDDFNIYNDQLQFMQKYFKNIIDDNSNVNKNILRGLKNGSKKEKILIDYGKAKNIYYQILKMIDDIYKLRDRIAKDATMIVNTVKNIKNMSSPLNESILLEYSIFKDEYFDIILESGITPDDVEKSNDKKIDINKNDNKLSKSIDEQYKMVVAWCKLCTSVTSAEMDILDEAYGTCVKFINKIMKS